MGCFFRREFLNCEARQQPLCWGLLPPLMKENSRLILVASSEVDGASSRNGREETRPLLRCGLIRIGGCGRRGDGGERGSGFRRGFWEGW